MHTPHNTPDLIGADDLEAEGTFNLWRGKKQYELSNHLGNVLATVSDRILPIEDDIVTGTVAYHQPDVLTISDYYPFGAPMEGRTISGDYRFGFNGKENIVEATGMGNWQDYGMRQFETRLARFVSTDPLIIQLKKYAWYSPYQFAGNKAISKVDIDGLEEGDTPLDDGSSNLIYPSSQDLKNTLELSFKVEVLNQINDKNFVENFGLTYDSKGQERFSELFLNQELKEKKQDDRQTYSGIVFRITTALADESLITESNIDGINWDTWKAIELPAEMVPENTSRVLNPGVDRNILPSVDLGNGKSIVYTMEIVIVEDQ